VLETKAPHSDLSLYKRAALCPQEGPVYGGLKIHAFPEVHERVGQIAAARLRPGAKVLDLASGSGAMCLRLINLGFSPVGCDAVPDNFRLHGRVPFFAANLNESLPPEMRGGFDCLVATELIEHLENPRHFLRQCFSALRPGGAASAFHPERGQPVLEGAFHPHRRFSLVSRALIPERRPYNTDPLAAP
jgi:SAM-dependent methyltransferase